MKQVIELSVPKTTQNSHGAAGGSCGVSLYCGSSSKDIKAGKGVLLLQSKGTSVVSCQGDGPYESSWCNLGTQELKLHGSGYSSIGTPVRPFLMSQISYFF